MMKLTRLDEKSMSLRDILISVCCVYGRSADDVMDNHKVRQREWIEIRQVFSFMAISIFGYSRSEVGRYLGKNHATIINCLKVIHGVLDMKVETNMISRIHQVYDVILAGLGVEPAGVVIDDSQRTMGDVLWYRKEDARVKKEFYANLEERLLKLRNKTLYGIDSTAVPA